MTATIERFPVDLTRAARVAFSSTGPGRFGAPRPGGRLHAGQDVFAPRGTPVLAPVAGRIVRVRDRDADRCGFGVTIRDQARNVWTLCHLNAAPVVDEGPVQAGDVLGVVGTSGDAPASSPHLHIQCVDEHGTPVNIFDELNAQRQAERAGLQRRPVASRAPAAAVGSGFVFAAILGFFAFTRRKARR